MKIFNILYQSKDLAFVEQFAAIAFANGFLFRLKPSEKPAKPRLYFSKDSTIGLKERAYLRTILRSLAALQNI